MYLKGDVRRLKRFEPFRIFFEEGPEHPRFREALAIMVYYVENAWAFGERAQFLSSVLRRKLRELEEQGVGLPYWTEFASKTELPLPEYLKVWADLTPEL